jgi:CRISPR-associated endoribonuclease Cas6
VLASIKIVICPIIPIQPISAGIGIAIRGWFYDAIAEAAPEIADRLHHANGAKPFTVSLLFGKYKQSKGMFHLNPQPYSFRVTVLTSELYSALRQITAIKMANGELIQLGGMKFSIERIVLGGEGEAYATQSNYEELWQTPVRRKYSFRFVTPTSFRMGRGHLPFPLPNSVYRGLWRKWNQFAPRQFAMGKEVLDTVQQQVFPSQHELKTKLIPRSGAKFLGFVGTCQFEVLGDVSEEHLHNLTVLSEFAYYAGVGSKTTEGMGQTLVVV